MESKKRSEIEALKAFADQDGSGFISTQEANDLRDLLEFGILMKQVEAESRPSVSALAEASGLSPESAEATPP